MRLNQCEVIISSILIDNHKSIFVDEDIIF